MIRRFRFFASPSCITTAIVFVSLQSAQHASEARDIAIGASCQRKIIELVTAGIGKAAYRGGLTPPLLQLYAASKDNIIKLIQLGNVDVQLTEILRNGARALDDNTMSTTILDRLKYHCHLLEFDGRRVS